MAGLTDTKGHLTKTYQYSVMGESTYGSATYENEYAYNGESYSPNIHSQYLRARYYSVATASFLTEDSCLGSIWEPLTLNRYDYCISSYPNYEDPSGNLPMLTPVIPSRIVPPDTVPETIREDIALLNFEVWTGVEYTRRAAGSFGKGVRDSITKAIMDKPFVSLLPWAALAEKPYNASHRQDFPNPVLGESQPLYHQWSPTETIKDQLSDDETKIQALAGDIENKNAYYLGRCAGDVVVGMGGMLESFGGGMTSMSGSVSLVPAALGGPTTTSVSITVTLAGVAITVDGAAQVVYACESLSKDFGRYQESRAEDAGSEGGTESKLQEVLDIAENYKLSDDTFNNHILNRHGPDSTHKVPFQCGF